MMTVLIKNVTAHVKASLVAQLVKNLPIVQETWVQFLGQEDPLEKEMATHSQYSYLEDSMVRRPCRGCSPWSVKESDTTE